MIQRPYAGVPVAGRLAVVLLVLTIGAAACSSDDAAQTTTSAANETTTTIQRQPEGSSSFFSFEEVLLGPDGYVALNNFTSVPVTLDGLHLCQGGDCFTLPDEVVPAGGIAFIATGAAPDVEGIVVVGATIGILAPSDGELALYVTDPADPEKIISYLQWGFTPHERTQIAIDKGLWQENGWAPSGDNAVRLYRDPDSGLWLWDAAS
jgi:hypothetical protein